MANIDEDDVYFDAISTDGPPESENHKTDHPPILSTSGETGNTIGKRENENHAFKIRTGIHKPGNVSDMINKFKDFNQKTETGSENGYLLSSVDSGLPRLNTGTTQWETFSENTVLEQTNTSVAPEVGGLYSFAKPFDEELSPGVSAGTDTSKTPVKNVNSFGYSHPIKEKDKSEVYKHYMDESEYPSSPQAENIADLAEKPDLTGIPAESNVLVDVSLPNVDVSVDTQENLYDSVRSSGFEVVNPDHVSSSSFDSVCTGSTNSQGRSKTGEKEMMRKLAEGINYEWKRKEAKKKSKALKRPSKTEKGVNPLLQHSRFDDPHDGERKKKTISVPRTLTIPTLPAIPEAEDDHPFNPFTEHSGSDTGSSCFTDSSFDSIVSDSDHLGDDDDFFPNKPLPPTPDKHHQIKDLAHKVLPGHTKKDSVNESPVLEPVTFRRHREPPTLPPETEGNVSQNQVKLRGVLQSLIETERNYIKSLERIRDVYQKHILEITKKPEVKVTFQKVEEIISIHLMFQIEFADKMKKWNQDETIGGIFHVFSQRMVVNIYSEYVNNYEAASETIKELESSKQSFKDFLVKKQMEGDIRLPLAGLMLKPVQRFPQFIMIIKDLLKYTPRDHHDREQLQEAVTWIENVAHQLNERKRQSEQFYHGSQIMTKLSPRVHMEKNIYLIRQDDMEQHSHDTNGSQFKKQRRIFLMNDRLISVHVPQRDGVDRYIYKWHQNLQNLELNTSAVTPNMQTKINIGETHSTIMSPKAESFDEDPYNVASDLTDMMHDISILAKIHHLAASLKLSYPTLSDDHIQSIMVKLQAEIQQKDYQLQMLNSNTIILQDKVRNKKYVFSASSAKVKQEWCIDFLLAKYSLDIINIPSWHKAEGSDTSQPALLMKHMSVDMQRTFTKITCGVKVYFPRKNNESEEHLWVCSSNEGQGQVSIVSLHTHKPSLIESFQATKCEILCAESVPGFATVQSPTAFEEDTVWMSTADSVIQVFMLSEKQADTHRQCIYTFNIGCMIISMRCIDDCVLCGNRSGTVIAFTRNDDGVWSEDRRITLGVHPVTSIICVGDHAWAVCGSSVYIIDVDTLDIRGKVDHQLTTKDGECKNFQYLVKTGVGVWASFIGQPNICLYHCESKRLLQDFNICSAINEFVKVYTGKDEKRNYTVTCLMVSLGMLWIGTNEGLILVYPLPRLRDGIPRINERPQVALHSHRGPVKFLIPVHYGPISGTPIRRRPASVLKSNNIDDTVIGKLPDFDKRVEVGDDQPKYLTLRGDSLTSEGLYEDVRFQGYQENQIYEEIGSLPKHLAKRTDSTVVENSTHVTVENFSPDTMENSNPGSSECSRGSGEHTYFILEPQDKQTGENSEVKATPANETKSHNSVTDPVGKLEADVSLVKDLENVMRRPQSSELELRQKDRNRRSDLKAMTLSLQECKLRPFPTNVQSELHNKLKNRKSMEDLTDREATEADVDILYPTLRFHRQSATLQHNLASRRMSSSVPDDLPNVSDESTYFRPRMSTPIRAKKPDMSSTRRKNSSKESSSSPEQIKQSSIVKNKKRSVSFNHGTETLPKKSEKNRIGSSFAGGSSVDTLRKQDTNTILVLSGGDGYRDWKKRQAQSNYRYEEPCLMFWMYRF